MMMSLEQVAWSSYWGCLGSYYWQRRCLRDHASSAPLLGVSRQEQATPKQASCNHARDGDYDDDDDVDGDDDVVTVMMMVTMVMMMMMMMMTMTMAIATMTLDDRGATCRRRSFRSRSQRNPGRSTQTKPHKRLLTYMYY